MRLSTGERIFETVNIALLVLVALSALFPVLYVISVSLTPVGVVSTTGGFPIIPRQITFGAYTYVMRQGLIPRAYVNSLTITTVGTIVNMILTILMAYPLSRKDLPARNLFLVMVLIPMLFSGGLIPLFILVKDLGLMNTYWSVILPGAVSSYNLLIMKTFFENLPDEIIESARLDGASEYRILWRIILPLSKPVIATLSLFYGVGHWNAFFQPMMFLTNRRMQPLQVILRDILTDALARETAEILEYEEMLPGQTLKMAAVMLSVIPLLIVYPFIQKYFTKGVLLGSVKG
jgi:putative aldouronate transport system permease protein